MPLVTIRGFVRRCVREADKLARERWIATVACFNDDPDISFAVDDETAQKFHRAAVDLPKNPMGLDVEITIELKERR